MVSIYTYDINQGRFCSDMHILGTKWNITNISVCAILFLNKEHYVNVLLKLYDRIKSSKFFTRSCLKEFKFQDYDIM